MAIKKAAPKKHTERHYFGRMQPDFICMLEPRENGGALLLVQGARFIPNSLAFHYHLIFYGQGALACEHLAAWGAI